MSAIASSPESIAASPNLTVAVHQGAVEHRKAGTTDWTRAGEGMALEVQDHVKTLAFSTAVVHFADGSRVKLHPNTEIAVDVFTLKIGGPPDGNRISKVRVVHGGIDVDVIDIDSDESIWQFITQDGVVAIQGTAGTLISKNSMWIGDSPKVEGAKGGHKNKNEIPTIDGGNDSQVLDRPGPSKDDQRGNQQFDCHRGSISGRNMTPLRPSVSAGRQDCVRALVPPLADDKEDNQTG